MINSIWKNETKLPEFPQLKGDIKTDVLIIGGGMAGLMCAYTLQQKGIDYILVEDVPDDVHQYMYYWRLEVKTSD